MIHKPEEGYHPKDPRLLLWRIQHRLLGRRQGCSCSTCFYHPRRRVPPSEFYADRRRLAKLEGQVRRLEQLTRKTAPPRDKWMRLARLEDQVRKLSQDKP